MVQTYAYVLSKGLERAKSTSPCLRHGPSFPFLFLFCPFPLKVGCFESSQEV